MLTLAVPLHGECFSCVKVHEGDAGRVQRTGTKLYAAVAVAVAIRLVEVRALTQKPGLSCSLLQHVGQPGCCLGGRWKAH